MVAFSGGGDSRGSGGRQPNLERSWADSKRSRRHATGASNHFNYETGTFSTAVPSTSCPPSPSATSVAGASLGRETIFLNSSKSRRLPERTRDPRRQLTSSSLEWTPGDTSRLPNRLIQADRLVHAPEDASAGPLDQTRRPHRSTLLTVHDKVFNTLTERYVRRVLREYDQGRTGRVPVTAFREALDRMHFGLSEEEKSKLVEALTAAQAAPAPAQGGSQGSAAGSVQQQQQQEQLQQQQEPSVDIDGFLLHCQLNQQLGRTQAAKGQYNLMTRMPWEPHTGGFRSWNFEMLPQKIPGVSDSAANGTYEQQAEDAFLLHLIANKFRQHSNRLRLIFRNMDANRNSLIDRAEFLGAVRALRVSVVPRQVERLFDIVDADKSGSIDYEEFIATFDAPAKPRVKPAERVQRGSNLAEALGITPDDVAATMRSPLVYELRRALYGRASGAHRLFQQYDINRDGYLSVDELTKCCQKLVSGLTQHDVGAIMTRIDGSCDGYLDYKEFVSHLVDQGVGHPRMVDAQLAAEAAAAAAADSASMRGGSSGYAAGGGSLAASAAAAAAGPSSSAMGTVRNTWGHGPIWNRPTTPTSVRNPSLSLPAGAALGSTAGGGGSTISPTATGSMGGGAASRHRSRPLTMEQAAAIDAGLVHDHAIASVLESLEEAPRKLDHMHSLPDLRAFSMTRSHAFSGGPPGGPAPSLEQTLDLSSFRVAQPFVSDEELAALKAKKHHTGKSFQWSRHWHTAHPPSNGTEALPGTSNHQSRSDTFVRKSDEQFMEFQRQDKGRRAVALEHAREHAEELAARLEGRISEEAEHMQRFDEGRLHRRAVIAERYNERATMYDASRQAEPHEACAVFGRFNHLHEHARPPPQSTSQDCY